MIRFLTGQFMESFRNKSKSRKKLKESIKESIVFHFENELQTDLNIPESRAVC